MRDDAGLLFDYASRRDEAAFAELVRRHLDLVYFAALRRCRGDRHQAEEVAQKVFTLLARDAAKLQRHAVLPGWLYVTTRNVAAKLRRDELGRRNREKEAWRVTAPEGDTPPVDWEQLRLVLDDVMDTLDVRDRNALLLRYFQGRSFAEIGGALQLKEDAARMRVSRALEKLRTLLVQRGIASTSAALGLALSAQVAAAKPAGLAASVTTAALAGAGAATTAGIGTTLFSFMSTGKFSTMTAVALATLLASLGGNAYLLARPKSVPPSRPSAAPRSPVIAAAAPAPLDPNELVRTGDLGALRDRLRADGATEPVIRGIMEGILRRRYREKLSLDRADRIARGWWKDAQRTWGTAESTQRLIDDPTLLRTMVTTPLEQLLGPDPLDVAEADAKYAFLPADLRQRLGAIDRALPGGWSPSGDPAQDRILRAEYESTRKNLEGDRTTLLAGLTSDQRQAYEMRFSRTGTSLAQQLELVQVTEQEFTAIYPFAEQYGKEYDGLFRLENGIEKAGELDRRFAQQIIAAVGYDRALDLIWSGATEYSAYARIAHDAGLPAGTAGRAVQLAADTSARAAAIHADLTLGLNEKAAALVTLQQQARGQLDALVPPAVQVRLAPAAVEWLESLGRARYKTIATVLPGRGNLVVMTGTIALSSTPPTQPALPLVPPRPTGL
jgi:RNA polymerase sigma factor (sigma-70 family)